jgi:DNA repair protein RecO (recombination protein O)
MLVRTKAIVLHTLKYSESSLIAHCYTQSNGKQSFILKGILTAKKGSIRKAQFQALTQLEILFNHKNNGKLQFLKEAKVIAPYQTIPNTIEKNALVQFLAETLKSAILEEDANPSLYIFLETALNWLDSHDDISDFHLVFLINLTKYLGFFPNDEPQNAPYFNLETGCFDIGLPREKHIEGAQVPVFRKLLGMNFGGNINLKLNRSKRRELLDTLLHYFELHLLGFSKPKSLQILNEIFDDAT